MTSLSGKPSGSLDFPLAERRVPGLGPPPPDGTPWAGVSGGDDTVRPPRTERRRVRYLFLLAIVPIAAGAAFLRHPSTQHGDARATKPSETRVLGKRIHAALFDAPKPDQLPRITRRAVQHPVGRATSKKAGPRPAAIAVVAVPPTTNSDPVSASGTADHRSQHEHPGTKQTQTHHQHRPGPGPSPTPSPSPTPRPDAVINHFYNPDTKDHRYLTNYEDGAAWDGYEYRGTEGKVFLQPAPGTKELTGQEGRIGYIYVDAHKNTTALYYCISGYGDLFTTDPAVADNAQAHAWDCQGIVGYVGL